MPFLVAVLLALPAPAAAQATIFPEWTGRAGDVLAGRREGLIDDRAALFTAGSATAGPLEDAVLLCRFDVEDPPGDRWDTFADPDLRVVLSSGRQRWVAWGTENSGDEVISFAGVDLAAGSALRFRVSDRDVTYDENIGSVTARFEGALPLVAEDGVIRVECRALDASVAAARRDEAFAQADALLPAAESANPDLSRTDLGAPALSAIESQLVAAIAYSGHRHEGARARSARLETARTRFEGLLRTAVRDAARSAPRLGTAAMVSGTEATVEELSCRGPARRFAMVVPTSTRCVVVLRYDGALAALGTPDALDRRGRSVTSIGVFAGEPGHVVIAFGERVSATLLLRLGAEPMALAALR